MSRRELQPCGTPGAYQRHRKADEPACDACKAAHREYASRWRAASRPPRRDVDELAVERAIHGDPPAYLTTAEREAVVRRLHGRGMSDGHIAKHLDIGRNGVQTIRRRLGLPATPPERRAVA